ncbi:family 20 glycosylhydrolase [Fulvivirga ligni]|uniref:family 20 glycosylhydrolase n=1 Tax=Fulvivirga ligni TaxID=2904246 RepID=UPI001F208E65|nr:family 20 glycosylhydrolase [Fulvivirga ligni]UII22887.1 family 20 glycosylhydrolase [Fulvivirga ligni]
MRYKRIVGWALGLIMIGSAYVGYAGGGEEGLNLMPYPKEVKLHEGKYYLNENFNVSIGENASDRLSDAATRFLRRLDAKTGLFFLQNLVKPAASEAVLNVKTEQMGEIKLYENESYQLEVKADGVMLAATTDLGAMHGLETLLQLVMADEKGYYLPLVAIADEPRFPWRGLMIDVSRHFHPIDVIKRNIDGLAAVKMNVLHLHLCDDQGFRVESKVYPQLMEKASDGKYFTQVEIKEVVNYAASRGIRVVPEFDFPGHATSFLTAFPELASAPGPYTIERHSGIFDPTVDPTNEKTYEVLDKLFTEMASLFPDEYFHIGGDENEGKHWDANADIQAFMKKNGIANNHELQTYFNNRILKTLKASGKKMMGWDEILHEGIPTSALIQSWRGHEGLAEAAKKGYKTILSNGYYIDLMHHGAKHYLNDPLPEGHGLTAEQQKNVLGGEATQWSELTTSLTIDSRIWPRTAAIAERLWSPGNINDVQSMYKRMEVISRELEGVGLTHIRNRDVILRNLCNSYDVQALKTLANVAEPMKGYTRNTNGTLYATYSPYTLFADVCITDAPDALQFKYLVDEYLADENEQSLEKIKKWLTKWEQNEAELKPVIDANPVLKSIEPMSKNLATISSLALEALSGIEGDARTQIDWFNNTLSTLNDSREQSGRTRLEVVDPIERIIKFKTAIIGADKTGSIKVDGSLGEWATAEWYAFKPFNYPYWNYLSDSCYFSVKWDDQNLYVAMKVKNRNLQALAKKRDQKGLHMDDGIEVLIDANYDQSTTWQDDDYAYHINILNAILDDRGMKKGEYNSAWNGKLKSAVALNGTLNNSKDKDQGYQVELAISWKELNVKPEHNKALGIDFAVNDRNDKTSEYQYYDFMNLTMFHNSKGFAKLVLLADDNKSQTSIE